MNNGKIQENCKIYNLNGVLCEEINYIDGIKHGICKLYDYATYSLVEMIYINGKCEEICKVFDKNGNYMYNRNTEFIKSLESLRKIDSFLIKLKLN